jgi:hypothetical protein
MTHDGERGRRAVISAVGMMLVAAACGTGTASSGSDGATGSSVPVTSPASSVTVAARCPSPAKAVQFSQPTPWRVIGRTGPEGRYRDKDVSESMITISNPNPIAVRARAIILVSDPVLDAATSRRQELVEFGVARKPVLRSDGGIDYSVDTPTEVPAGGTVQVVARRLTTASPTTIKAQYGSAVIVALPAVSESCDIPVAGADPIRLLPGGVTTKGCTDPAAGC